MSYDENRISDQIDGGLHYKEQLQKNIEQLIYLQNHEHDLDKYNALASEIFNIRQLLKL